MKPLKNISIASICSKIPSPKCGIEDYILMYDNFNGEDSLKKMYNSSTPLKLREMIIMLVTDGNVGLNINQKDLTLHQGSCVCMMPESIIKFGVPSNNFKYLLYVMYQGIINDVLTDIGISYNMLTMSHDFYHEKCDDNFFSYRTDIYNELKEELLRDPYKYQKLFVRSYANIIMINNITLFNQQFKPQGNTVSQQDNLYRSFISLLNKHCIRERAVQFYAEQLGITPKYLSAVSLQYSGKNASMWISEFVVEKAKNLLREQQYTIKEVSEILNFKSQGFFGRYFKRVSGMSPKTFITKNTN